MNFTNEYGLTFSDALRKAERACVNTVEYACIR